MDENNKVVGLKGIAQDITKKKELELFLKAQEEVEKERQIKALEEKVTAGEIEVISAYGKTTEQIAEIREAVKP